MMKLKFLLKLLFFKIFFINLSFAESLFLPIQIPILDENKVKLGEKIFFDTNLNEAKISCNNCHNLYFNKSGTSVKNNAPTILNVALSTIFEYKNINIDLFERTKKSLFSEKELNVKKDEFINLIKKNSFYKKEFAKIYNDKITLNNVVDALSEFEKSLVTPNSKFDKFLKKEISLNQNELNGFYIFLNSGCVTCHNGVNLGSNSFVFSNKKNKFIKVPTLRNITKTAPYFNNDRNLTRTVLAISKEQGVEINSEQAGYLSEFLKTLDGEI